MRRSHLVIVVFQRRIESDTFLQDVDCLLMLSSTLVRLAQMEIRVGIIRLLAGRFFQQADGRFPVSLDDVENSEIEVSKVLMGIGGQLNLELLYCVADPRSAVLI